MKIWRINPLLFLTIFYFPFFVTSCGGDDDSEPKDMEAPLVYIETPVEGDSFVRGVNDIKITGEITDNQALDTCVISLSTDLKGIILSSKSTSVDGGENNGGGVIASIDDPEPFEPDAKGYSLSGKSHTFSGESPFGVIPDDATAGKYILMFEITDKSGNSVTRDISIQITAK